MSARLNRRPFLSGLKIGVAVMMVAGLFLLWVMLAPPVPAVQAIFIQPLASTPVASEPASVSGGGGFSGTLASFTALIPEIASVYIPMVVK